MKSVGMRMRSATPIQKMENTSAVTMERASMPSAKEMKIASGVQQTRSWTRRKDCVGG
jgi:hypothetical protein